MTRAFVGLGSNQGDRRAHLARAVVGLRDIPGTRVARVSSCYDTAPVGRADSPRFLNAVVELDTGLNARDLWRELAALEAALGRPAAGRAGARGMDIDLLYHGDTRCEGGLEVPHPRRLERLFVLVPMTEVAPDWRDPRVGLRMDELLRERPRADLVRFAGRLEGSG